VLAGHPGTVRAALGAPLQPHPATLPPRPASSSHPPAPRQPSPTPPLPRRASPWAGTTCLPTCRAAPPSWSSSTRGAA
jgi:hypothetical protein